MLKCLRAVLATVIVMTQAMPAVTPAKAAPVAQLDEPPSLQLRNGQLAYQTQTLQVIQIGDSISDIQIRQAALAAAEAAAKAAILAVKPAVVVKPPPTPKATPRAVVNSSLAEIKATLQRMCMEVWANDSECTAIAWIVNKESGFNPNAREPHTGSCGLFQFNPCSKMHSAEVASQIQQGIEYIKDRYGSPVQAKSFWLQHNWY